MKRWVSKTLTLDTMHNTLSLTPTEVALPSRVQAKVVAQREEARAYFRLRLHAPSVAHDARAGQFVHILARAGGENGAAAFDPLLRRAFSIMKVEADDIEILYRAGGRGTDLMARWRAGDHADVLGPLGQGFGEAARRNLLVGGGVGVPPLVMLASRVSGLDATEPDTDFTALIGARTAADVVCEHDFAALEVPCEVATEDGSRGQHGRVTKLLTRHLAMPRPLKVFACGPLPMLRAVAELCLQASVECEVSLEESMPCGIGVCNGCVVPVLTTGDDYGRYRRICVEGPVLNAREVDWARF